MPQLLEFTRLAPQGVDRAAGLLRGVKVLGLESRNGRSYLPQALVEAAPLYEGAKVNVDHPSGHPAAPRAYRDRLGVLRQVRLAEDGLYADLHFNPRHPLAEQLAWDAEHAPDNVGLSHNVQAVTSSRDGRLVVESITRVESVDLVTNPATTRGLFEQAPQSPPVEEPAMSIAWQELTLDALRANRPDLAQSLLEEQSARHAADLAQRDRLQAELDALRVREALAARRANIHRLLAQARLPQEAASELFLEQLLAADEPECARLIADRQKLVEQAWSQAASAAPRSRDQHAADRPAAPVDALAFARLLR